LAHLRERGRTQRCAIMCAETVWWRCHRRIITDYLLAAGETVFHILGPGQVEAAALNEVAQVQGAGTLVGVECSRWSGISSPSSMLTSIIVTSPGCGRPRQRTPERCPR